ncbi:uncharacterized protein LOC119606830 [Lucilia sericata]|uniref:uncharacterized protein LOC119606830 n=1 Tax=Lucilia sericata TaxID=13632 RepID=UPI0018A83B47|nr:uncharacterized protein LOC119606830 [Lucilia sericata]
MNSNLGTIIYDNSFFESQLRNYSNNLKIGHLNLQSFALGGTSTKLDELRNVLSNNLFDVVGITETWLTEYISSNSVYLPGYVICRNDRPGITGGGVALYVSRSLKFNIICRETKYKTNRRGDRSHVSAEFLFIEITVSGRKILVGVVYLPHGDLTSIEDSITDVLTKYNDIVIIGDFNNNMFDISRAVSVREMCSRLNMICHHNSLPTHLSIRFGSTSLIDYFLISPSMNTIQSGQVQIPGTSRHSFIYAVFDVKIPMVKEFIEYFDFNDVDYSLLEFIFNSCDFDRIFYTADVNEQANLLFLYLCQMHSAVPFKKRKVCRFSDDSWFNSPEIKNSLTIRNASYRLYLRKRSKENWNNFCRLRNRSKTIIRNAKRKAHATLFHDKNSEQIWNTLRANGIGDTVTNIDKVDVENLNSFFSSNQGSLEFSCHWERRTIWNKPL